MEFDNKVVLVTGGNYGGIGGQIALDFSEKGANVAIVSRSLQKLKVTEEKCKEKRNNCKVLLIESDLSKFENLEGIISKVVDEFGRLDVLVNNAAMYCQTTYSNDTFDDMMNINTKAPMFLCHYAVPELEKTKGVIINISTILTSRPVGLVLEYSMTKAALNMMSDILAKELIAKGIRVNTVSPGLAKTNFAPQEVQAAFAPAQPLSGLVDPSEISNAVIFLSSDVAKHITGVDIAVDGGNLAAR